MMLKSMNGFYIRESFSYAFLILYLYIISIGIEEAISMLFKSKSNGNLIKNAKNKDLTLLHLSTLSNFLQSEQKMAQDITKEIKNEVNLAEKNEKIINKSIAQIKENAEELVRRFEEEKEKNEKLQFLVKHIEGEIYKEKLDKSVDLRNNKQTDKLQELTNALLTREKDLEKVCEKANTSSYELSKKMDIIRALRSERTIVSSLFDKIERELCNLEHCYKVLVIEGTVGEQEYLHKIEEFNRYQSSAGKELQRMVTKMKNDAKLEKDVETLNVVLIKSGESNFKNRVSSLNLQQEQTPLQPPPSSIFGQSTKEKEKMKEKKNKLQNQLLRIQREKKVKLVFNDLGLLSSKQLPESIESLQEENEGYLKQINDLLEQIELTRATIGNLNKKKKNSKIISSSKRHFEAKQEQLRKVSEKIRGSKLQICKILFESIKETLVEEEQVKDFYNQQEEIKHYMGYLEAYFSHSYLSNKNHVESRKKEDNLNKRLTSLLSNHQFERNHMSIYEEKDLIEFARKNMEQLQKSVSRRGD